MRIYYKPIRVRLWLVYKITRNNCSSQFFANFIRTQKYLSYLFRQNQYSNLKIEAVIWRCSVKKVFRNFTKFTGKHLCQSLFFNKTAGLGAATLLKKRLWQRCFPVKFVKFLRTSFLTEHLRWLLLKQKTKFLVMRPSTC